jgi:hypothetical protein
MSRTDVRLFVVCAPLEHPNIQALEQSEHRHEIGGRLRRAAWGLVCIILAVAALGGMGPGYLSHRELVTSDGSRVEYYAMERHQRPTELKIHPANEKLDQVKISSSYFEGIELVNVQPSPEAVIRDGMHVTFKFAGAGTSPVVFRITPDQMGTHSAAISLGDGTAVQITQFVYP